MLNKLLILSTTLASNFIFETIATGSYEATCPLELKKCSESYCHCDDWYANEHCKQDTCSSYHGGCNQCEDGYWHKDKQHGCVHCQDTFGEGCVFCQDYNGCGQCSSGYERYYIAECGVWGCKKTDCTFYDTETTSVDCDIDLVMAFDESGSIGDGEFDNEQEFGVTVVDALDAGTQIALLAFDGDARVIHEFSDSQDRNDIKSAINGIIQGRGSTNFEDTIDLAITTFNGGSPDRPDVLLLITDGMPNVPDSNPCNVVPDIVASGMTLVVVGIGAGFNPSSGSVTCLVENDSSRIITASSFDPSELQSIVENVKDRVCQREIQVLVCPNGHKDSRGFIDENNCPIKCDHEPCECCEQCFCKWDTCSADHGGCNQCQDGYFQKNKNYPCIQCQEMFGDGCMFCQDYHGCGQCKDGYERVYDHTCQLYKCVPKSPSWWSR
jgi:hypothetical protein